MKKISWLLVCLAIVAFGSVAAQASDGNSPFRANIPFAFTVQNVSYDAGTYTIYESDGFLHIRNEQDKSEKAYLGFRTDRFSGSPKSELQFKDVGGKRQLTKIWAPGRQVGLELIYKHKQAEQVLSAAGSR